MNGRLEHSIKIENKIKLKLNNSPDILSDYYYSLSDKTPKTKEVYINYVFDFLTWCNNNYAEIKKADVDRYMEAIRYRKDKNGNRVENSASIRRSRLAAIISFYDFLIDNDIVDSNPATKVNKPKNKTDIEVVAMTTDEVLKVENNIRDRKETPWTKRDMAIVVLGCTTGLRVTAISEINIEDIDFENNTLDVVEKGNKTRTVYYGEKTRNALLDWLAERDQMETDSDALFLSNRRKRIAQRTIADIIAKYTANLDKHITPHKMRSTCATNLYQETGDIYLTAEVLGHANISNTRKYARVSEQKRRRAADILDDLYR